VSGKELKAISPGAKTYTTTFRRTLDVVDTLRCPAAAAADANKAHGILVCFPANTKDRISATQAWTHYWPSSRSAYEPLVQWSVACPGEFARPFQPAGTH